MIIPKPLKRKSPKDWDKKRAELKVRFKAVGITYCEAQLENCTQYRFLFFAHSKTKQYIKTEADLEECILCCNNCHFQIEKHPLMEEFVKEVIKQRRVQP